MVESFDALAAFALVQRKANKFSSADLLKLFLSTTLQYANYLLRISSSTDRPTSEPL